MSEAITIRIPRPVAYAVAALVLAGLLVVTPTLLSRGEGAARADAERYLTALSDGDPRTAWAQLSHRVQTIWGSYETFEREVAAADWSRFEFAVADVRCDDNVCGVALFVPNGVDSVPLLLHQGPTHFWWGSGDTLVFSDKFFTDASQLARVRGDSMAMITIIYGVLPWDERGVT